MTDQKKAHPNAVKHIAKSLEKPTAKAKTCQRACQPGRKMNRTPSC